MDKKAFELGERHGRMFARIVYAGSLWFLIIMAAIGFAFVLWKLGGFL